MSEGVLIQDATGRSYSIPASRLEEFVVDSPEATAGTVTCVLPGEDIVEELPSMRRAMLQFGS